MTDEHPLLTEEQAAELRAVASNLKPSQATKLISLAQVGEFFHSPDGVSFATIPVADHRETWPLRSRSFRNWLARRFYEEEAKAPSAQALQDAIGVLEGEALFDGVERPVHVRVAEHDGAIYLDLATARWEAVEITAEGWRVVVDPAVRFRRARGMESLPYPKTGGLIDELRYFLNLDGDETWMLLVGSIVNAFRPAGPFPVVNFLGEQGSAKSTNARLVRALVDPNTAPLRSEPRETRDLMIAATNAWMVAFDNLGHLSPWLSDALCRLATGGGFATRELYSDSDEAIFDAKRPVMLNGIEELATRGDLLDRSLIFYMPTISDEDRCSERDLWRDFDNVRPRILGALLDAVSAALRRLPEVELEVMPRMADFAEWVTAAEPSLGWQPGKFLEAYAGNRESADELTLEASAIAGPVRILIESKPFGGTATDLLALLGEAVDETVSRRREWPKNARALSAALRRIAPNLRRIGIEVEFITTKGKRQIRIASGGQEQRGGFASLASLASSSEPNHAVRDAKDAKDASSQDDSYDRERVGSA